MSLFEIGMLVCFGISWPLSILKQYQSKRSEGKSLLFAAIVFFGYIFGILHKSFYHFDLVILLYIMNIVFVMIDMGLTLYYRYKKRN